MDKPIHWKVLGRPLPTTWIWTRNASLDQAGTCTAVHSLWGRGFVIVKVSHSGPLFLLNQFRPVFQVQTGTPKGKNGVETGVRGQEWGRRGATLNTDQSRHSKRQLVSGGWDLRSPDKGASQVSSFPYTLPGLCPRVPGWEKMPFKSTYCQLRKIR